MSNEVRELLDALNNGTLTLDDVAQRFRVRRWPSRDEPPLVSHREVAVSELNDPDPYVAGSYDDVVAAYDLGRLTDEQYTVLVAAIAEAQRAEDAGEA